MYFRIYLCRFFRHSGFEHGWNGHFILGWTQGLSSSSSSLQSLTLSLISLTGVEDEESSEWSALTSDESLSQLWDVQRVLMFFTTKTFNWHLLILFLMASSCVNFQTTLGFGGEITEITLERNFTSTRALTQGNRGRRWGSSLLQHEATGWQSFLLHQALVIGKECLHSFLLVCNHLGQH